MEWGANWKNLIENFIESYHVPIAHQKTLCQFIKNLLKIMFVEKMLIIIANHYAPQKLETGLGAAHPKNTKLEGVWRRMMVDFCVFPNRSYNFDA